LNLGCVVPRQLFFSFQQFLCLLQANSCWWPWLWVHSYRIMIDWWCCDGLCFSVPVLLWYYRFPWPSVTILLMSLWVSRLFLRFYC
jgi:hypothetical protein